MVVGTLRCDLLLGDVHSLKEKRAVIRPLLAELRRFSVAVAETGSQELYRRAEVSVAAVGGDHAHVVEILAACEQLVARHPELELLAARRRLLDDDDVD